jgi:hypothetical protein
MLFFIIVISFALCGAVISSQFVDPGKLESELTVTVWALVGVIVGCGVATYFGIV